MRYLLIVPLLAGSLPVHAATLRPMTTLHAPTVTVRDLWDDAGPAADRVLGPGPAPGARIVVEAPQLAAIARQFGVDWRPVSRADRAMLERPGRPLGRTEAIDAVRRALIAAGAAADCDIELPGFNPPIVPFDVTLQTVVAALDYDPGSGRFSAILSVSGQGMELISMRVTGQADDTIDLPVTTARIVAGKILHSEDVHLARVHTSMVHGEVAHTLEETIGRQIKRQIAPGQPLLLSDLTAPSLVHRGALVRMTLDSPGLALAGQGIALEGGAIGERIRIQNPVSRAIVQAEVIGADRVRVYAAGGVVRSAAADGLPQ